MIDALADLPVRIVVTVGDAADPAALGPLPAQRPRRALDPAGGDPRRGGRDGRPRRLRHHARRAARRRPAGRRAAVRRPALQRRPDRRRSAPGSRRRRRAPGTIRAAVERLLDEPASAPAPPASPARRSRCRRSTPSTRPCSSSCRGERAARGVEPWKCCAQARSREFHDQELFAPAASTTLAMSDERDAFAGELRVGERAVGARGAPSARRRLVRQVRDRARGEQAVEVGVVRVVSQERSQRARLAAAAGARRAVGEQQRQRRHEPDRQAEQDRGGPDVGAALARLRLGVARPPRSPGRRRPRRRGPTTGTSTSRIDSPVRTTAAPAPSAERVTSLTLSRARPAVQPEQRPRDHPGDHERVGEEPAARVQEPVAHGR